MSIIALCLVLKGKVLIFWKILFPKNEREDGALLNQPSYTSFSVEINTFPIFLL